MTTWKEIKLGEIADVIGGGTPSTKNSSFWGGEIPWLTPKDLSGYNKRYISEGERNITLEGLNSSSSRLLPKNTILLTSRAPIGYLAISSTSLCTNQGFKSIVLKQGFDPLFFFYLLKNNIEYIISMSSGSTFAEISGSQVKNLTFRIPEDIDVQKKIAGVLSALDDKIELNNQINSNLEQQAQALFKSWFIDFEPFGGKMPNDWKQYKIKEFVPVITGKKNANVSSNTGKYPFFSCSQTIARTNEYSFNGRAILVAGNGDFNVKFYDGKFEAYQRTYVLIPYQQQLAAWLFYAIKYNLNNIISSARGSVISFITKGSLEESVIAAPRKINNMPIMETLSKIADIILHKIKENQRLSEIRDSLLPKLMSGEIDVSKVDIEQIINNKD